MNALYLLKKKGPCEELVGRVKVVYVFLSTPTHPISEKERNDFLADIAVRTQRILMREKNRYGVELDVSSWWYAFDVPFEYSSDKKWAPKVMEKCFKSEDVLTKQNWYVKGYGLDSTPFVFVFGGEGEWYAHSSTAESSRSEFAVCFLRPPQKRTSCAHELLHLYGAMHLFGTPKLDELSKLNAPKSVMYDVNGTTVDTATAFLIGWTRNMSDFCEKVYDIYDLWKPAPPTPTARPSAPPDVMAGVEKKYVAVRKNHGPCKEFFGKMMIMLVFVSTPTYEWTDARVKAYCEHVSEGIGKFTEQAKSGIPTGKTFELDYCFFRCKTNLEFDEDREFWYDDVMSNFFKFDSIAALQDCYSRQFNVESTPIVFVFDRNGGDYSRPSRVDRRNEKNEYAICFAREDDLTHTFMHELLHLYGAADVYKPQEIKDAAWRLIPNSVMLQRRGFTIDDLTAYLIGWKRYKPAIVKIFADLFEKHKADL